MIPGYINIAGITKENRHDMIDYIVSCVNSCSGWIINHTMFSNLAIGINFQIEAKDVNELLKLLNSNGLKLTKESIEISKNFPEKIEEEYKHKEISAAINITFVHNDPDLKIIIPAVPG